MQLATKHRCAIAHNVLPVLALKYETSESKEQHPVQVIKYARDAGQKLSSVPSKIGPASCCCFFLLKAAVIVSSDTGKR